MKKTTKAKPTAKVKDLKSKKNPKGGVDTGGIDIKTVVRKVW